MAVENARETPYASECRLLWRVAMLVFVVTIAIGLVNGQRIAMIDPQAERSILLTHLHTGTIGWVTLSLFVAVIWLFTAGRTATEDALSFAWSARARGKTPPDAGEAAVVQAVRLDQGKGNVAVELGVVGEVDALGRAFTQQADDLIAASRKRSGLRRGRRGALTPCQ